MFIEIASFVLFTAAAGFAVVCWAARAYVFAVAMTFVASVVIANYRVTEEGSVDPSTAYNWALVGTLVVSLVAYAIVRVRNAALAQTLHKR